MFMIEIVEVQRFYGIAVL